MNRNGLFTPLAAGAIFLLVFTLVWATLDSDLYECRDDGVITMSAARNLVDLGFVGVNPSGPRVEASSSPLQFLAYSLAYGATGVDCFDFARWQTLVSTFLLGFLLALFFARRPLFALPFAVVAALGLTAFFPFFLWQASGMENALTHVMFLASVYVLFRFAARGRISLAPALVLFLASICRIESVYQIGLLLLLFTLYWYGVHKSSRGLGFSALVLALWLAFMVVRFLYFGQLFPNTAQAQNISPPDRLLALLTLNGPILWESFKTAAKIFLRQGGWLLLIGLPFLVRTETLKALRARPEQGFLALASAVLISASVLHPFLFGPTRIDISRAATQAAPLVFLLLAVLYLNAGPRRKLPALGLGVLLLSLAVFRIGLAEPYHLGWSTGKFGPVADKFVEFAQAQEIRRPTVCNPDLGIMSWPKRFNIVDLGMIGSPVLARLADRPGLLGRYLLEVVSPDIIHIHGSWIRRYCPSLLRQPGFLEIYRPLADDPRDPDRIRTEYPADCDREYLKPVFWVRQDILKGSGSAERRFLDSLQAGLSAEKVGKELAGCGGDCGYVARTVYRFIPELREAGLFEETLRLFSDPLDKALLTGWRNPGAERAVIRWLKAQGPLGE